MRKTLGSFPRLPFFSGRATRKFIDGLKTELGESPEGLLLSSILKVPYVKDVEHVLELLEALLSLKKHPLKEFLAVYKTSISLPSISNNLSDQLRIAKNFGKQNKKRRIQTIPVFSKNNRFYN